MDASHRMCPIKMKSEPSLPASSCSLQMRSTESLFVTDFPLLRDELHPEIARTLLDWAGSTENRTLLEIHIEVPRRATTITEEQVAGLVNSYFFRVADDHTRRIGDVFRYARSASLVALLVVILLLSFAQAIPEGTGQVMAGLRESFMIFAWVAMWKPAELWLYAHWPLRHWRRAALRLARARVNLVSSAATGDGRQRQP